MPDPIRIDLTQGDSGPTLDLHVVRMHPTAGPTTVDLTGATILFQARVQGAASFLATAYATCNPASGASAGHAFLVAASRLTATAGQYQGQAIIDLPDGTRQTAPPEQPYLVIVHARV